MAHFAPPLLFVLEPGTNHWQEGAKKEEEQSQTRPLQAVSSHAHPSPAQVGGEEGRGLRAGTAEQNSAQNSTIWVWDWVPKNSAIFQASRLLLFFFFFFLPRN